MRDRPAGITGPDLERALADGWGLRAVAFRYVPVGAGSYHWAVRGGQGERRFVTVDDLDGKAWLGRTRPAVFTGLRAAMDAAVTLHREAALGFVVAPVPALDGETVRPLGARHAVTVFPFLRGAAGRWGEALPAPERDELAAMLAALHRADPATVRLPRCETALPRRGDLETALRELGQPWYGGPFAELARELLAGAAGQVRRHLETLDRWASGGAPAGEAVITHGEPHPGNIMRVPSAAMTPGTAMTGATAMTEMTAGTVTTGTTGMMLIDWDTTGLAPPERDLWMLASETGDELRRYTELTGRPVDRTALELYRLRWALDDTCYFIRDFRAPHRRTAGTEHTWQSLQRTIAGLAEEDRRSPPYQPV